MLRLSRGQYQSHRRSAEHISNGDIVVKDAIFDGSGTHPITNDGNLEVQSPSSTEGLFTQGVTINHDAQSRLQPLCGTGYLVGREPFPKTRPKTRPAGRAGS
jgi:hypothetical protein